MEMTIWNFLFDFFPPLQYIYLAISRSSVGGGHAFICSPASKKKIKKKRPFYIGIFLFEESL